MKNILQKICFTLLLTIFSTAYAGSCFKYPVDINDCKRRAELGDVNAKFTLGSVYMSGVGVPQNNKLAFKWFRKAAEQGDATALFALGEFYWKGIGVHQDSKRAAKWFRKAAEQGDATAPYNLGLMYFKGDGVPQDYVMAHMYLNIAAANGYRDAEEIRNNMTDLLSPSQLSEAQKLAREWVSKNQ